MNSKERVKSVFEFVQPDYTPIDIYTTPEVHQTLAAWLNVKSINEVWEAVVFDSRSVNSEYNCFEW